MSSDSNDKAFRLDGQVALVTGGGSGLGFAIARALVEAGATVAITGRREQTLDEAVGELGPSARRYVFDVTQLGQTPAFVDDVQRDLGRLDVLVNNAGIHLKKPALEIADEEFARVWQTHVAASFAMAREAARHMTAQRHGSIIFVGSMAGQFGIPNVAAYSAAKAAVEGLTRALAVEWAASGVRVNAVVPGWIETAMSRSALENDPQRKAKILGRTPMRRLGEPADIGHAVRYLCAPAAGFVTGTCQIVDGGAVIGF